VSIVGVGVIAAAFGIAATIFAAMLGARAEAPFVRTYWDWMPAGSLNVAAGLHLDQLSMLMTLIITGVGTLIHLFSVGYMRDDGAYARYFAYLNLFVFFMLLLVLGSSYALMFVGWEGVGLCSFLLIGFWFTEKANADAGKKAFIVNRIGDFGFLVAMFLMFWNLGSLDFGPVSAAAAALPPGTAVATTIALFLFLGCAGKSAQMPLYVWLPDADGRADARVGADPRGDDGDRGRVPDRPQLGDLRGRAGREPRRRAGGVRHRAVRGADRPQAVGHQEGPRVLHGLAARLHVRGRRRGGVYRRGCSTSPRMPSSRRSCSSAPGR
jgi:hypothetical protein